AKAGNINNALKHAKGEFVAIFDCDHVPTRSFLQMTMGWFLKEVRSPVRIGGVVVGRVEDISLDPKTYLPRVTLDIEERYNHIP
ncbi:glycosyltransferase, partial [Salmonella enterica subsp. enterica serovar Anatum]|nr:glycosyltransferase [Salmonella enterica subsp. enterica serovar Anatum]